jgi:hypothetical protein
VAALQQPEISRPAGTKVSEPVVGLEGSTEYTVCMDASITKNGETEKMASNTVTFTTLPEKPSVILEQSGSVTLFEATVEAQVNPENQPTTSCVFEYSQGAEAPKTAVCEQPLGGPGLEIASAKLTGLVPGKTYSYHVIIKNATGKAESAVGPFTTLTLEKPVVESESTSGVSSSGATLQAQVNPEYQQTTCEFQYGTELSLTTSTSVPCSEPLIAATAGPTGESPAVSGLEVDTTYYFRVIAKNGTGETEGTGEFTTQAASPLVSTGAFSELGQSSVNVTGTVTPEGAETRYYYQYGPSTEYGQRTSPGEPGISVGAGVSAVAAPATLIPLVPGVSYHYRLVAWNEDGTSYGQDQTFTAIAGQSLLAVTGHASGISVNGASISGTINPQGNETSYRFEYGTNTGYATQAFGTVLPEQGVQTVTLSLRGLNPGTTYHYRLVVSNPAGTSEGADQTFTTPGILDPLVNPAATPLIANPAIVFPAGSQANTGTTTKTLTSAQKLAAALKVCKKEKSKSKRARCKTQARKRYGPAKKTKKK